MSWDIWKINGYGFKTTSVDANKLFDFLNRRESTLPEHLRQLIEEIRAERTDEEFVELTYDDFYDVTDTGTLAEYIAPVVNKETGIVMEPVGISDGGEEALLFCPCYPWQLNDKEKTLTEDKLHEILKPYMRELGIEDACFGHHEMVFSG